MHCQPGLLEITPDFQVATDTQQKTCLKPCVCGAFILTKIKDVLL